ncbi:MAG: DUF362 domain-containing protein [Spirochaetaceae bacterium]|nr:MAG: DUF362 domain-containing protein [Spirochaetaceae bacterium]
MNEKNDTYRVRAVQCDLSANDEAVYQALKRATDPLERSWSDLASARRIGIKINQDWNPETVVMRHGHRQQLVSDSVVRATLRLIREHSSAEIFVVDVGVESAGPGKPRDACTNIRPVLDEFGVRFIDGTTAPVAWAPVPGGGLMFGSYPVPAESLEADAFISIQKAKNHLFTGVTLSLKNLFGLTALHPVGRPRHYYHHIIRLPYVLADLGRIFAPSLNILDAIVCQAGQEWGPGDHPQDSNTIIAGDHTIATDACVAHLMGHDPAADWLTPPFHRDRNPLLIAAENGFGTVDLSEIDFESEVAAPIGDFFSKEIDSRETVVTWHRTMCEQAMYFAENRESIVAEHAGKYILLQMGEVKWSDTSGDINVSRRRIAGSNPDESLWLKFVDPDESEAEKFRVYSHALERFAPAFR